MIGVWETCDDEEAYDMIKRMVDMLLLLLLTSSGLVCLCADAHHTFQLHRTGSSYGCEGPPAH